MALPALSSCPHLSLAREGFPRVERHILVFCQGREKCASRAIRPRSSTGFPLSVTTSSRRARGRANYRATSLRSAPPPP